MKNFQKNRGFTSGSEKICKFTCIEFERTRSKTAGFTMFVAMVITGTLLLISTGIVTLALKQSAISASGRESQEAFYVADTGLECALYWDVKNPAGQSAFDITTPTTIDCNRDATNPANQWAVGGSAQSQFTITFLPDAACATVTVTKSGATTLIESLGYNSCDSSNPRRVERAVRASY